MQGKRSFEDDNINDTNSTFDNVHHLPLNINLSNHDLNSIEDFEEALKNEIIIYDE